MAANPTKPLLNKTDKMYKDWELFRENNFHRLTKEDNAQIAIIRRGIVKLRKQLNARIPQPKPIPKPKVTVKPTRQEWENNDA